MKRFIVLSVLALLLSGSTALIAQQEPRIVVRPEKIIQEPQYFEEPMPLDRTIRLVIKINGPGFEREIVLLCATSVFAAEVRVDDEENPTMFGIGGGIRIIRSAEILVTYDFESASGGERVSGSGSIKLRLGNGKTVFQSGDFTLTIHAELEQD